jgi:methionyl-tRNA formyltransferase
MDLIFCGTPQFAVPTLEKLVSAGHDVQLVVTQPDRPRGRGMEVTFSPVKQKALELDLPVTQPDKIKNNQEFRAQLEAITPEAIVVVGYGRIIPGWMLELPKHGNINLHASLLPKYRGAAPIQWAIAEGETVTGVTTMLLNAGLDTGDILLQEEWTIKPDDTAVTIAPPLAAIGAELMLETLRGLATGTIIARPQSDKEATLAPILAKGNGRIDFRRKAVEIFNRQRGFQPWPGAFTMFRGKNLMLTSLRPLPGDAPRASGLEPGLMAIAGDSLLAGCGEQSALEILELQPEGKRRMSAHEFINGYRPRAGERLGEPPQQAEEPRARTDGSE